MHVASLISSSHSGVLFSVRSAVVLMMLAMLFAQGHRVMGQPASVDLTLYSRGAARASVTLKAADVKVLERPVT
jgi:hypothetical protein